MAEKDCSRSPEIWAICPGPQIPDQPERPADPVPQHAPGFLLYPAGGLIMSLKDCWFFLGAGLIGFALLFLELGVFYLYLKWSAL
jgi:hypothetical protein